MKLAEHLLRDLAPIIIGDNENIRFPYLTGNEIVELFNLFCQNKDKYPDSLTAFNKLKGEETIRTRKEYSIDKLIELNNQSNVKNVLTKVIQKSHFLKYGKEDIYDLAIRNCNEILRSEGYRIETIEGVASFLGKNFDNDPIELQIYFKDIKNQILASIQESKATIWVAMAWFTDIEIMRVIFQKQRDGLDVKIIVFDEIINIENGILNESKKIHYNQLFKVKYDDYRIKMHNKFCIIDMKKVLHGSFNYSLTANKNDETFEILIDYNKALEFSQEFLRLLKIATKA